MKRPYPPPVTTELRASKSPWTVGRIAFAAHLIAFTMTVLLVMMIDPYSGVLTALAWGIGLALHGFFAVVVPTMRDRWVESELARTVPTVRADERRASGDRHAREVERLAASLAHEIRNPIAAAKSLVQQIAEDPAARDVPEFANVAIRELDRVEASIVHLLRFAREEPLRSERVGLDAIVDAALETSRDALAGVRVERERSPVVLSADPEKLRRVVVNLVSNAADAMRSSPAERRVLAIETGTSLDARFVWLRVRDHGPGMAEDVREHVFDAWVTGKDSGNGLGLPIARKLCEAHGGSLEIERSDAAGTSMLVTLPKDVP